eukprot:2542747-Amphidinium_carterae.1
MLDMPAAAVTIQGAARSRRTIRAGDETLNQEGQMDGTLSGAHLPLESPEFMKQVEEEGIFDRRDMEPPFRPPPEARGPGYWTTEGVWTKVVEDENERGPVAPKPPPPNAVGTGRWNLDGKWVEGGKKKRSTPPPPPPPAFMPPMCQKEKYAFLLMSKDERQDYSKLMSIE